MDDLLAFAQQRAASGCWPRRSARSRCAARLSCRRLCWRRAHPDREHATRPGGDAAQARGRTRPFESPNRGERAPELELESLEETASFLVVSLSFRAVRVGYLAERTGGSRMCRLDEFGFGFEVGGEVELLLAALGHAP